MRWSSIPYYSGDATDMYEQWVSGTTLSGGPVIGPGRVIDTDRYYVVLVDPLGLWGASKPSDGLGQKFPQYSYQDMVQATYRLLRDHLMSRMSRWSPASRWAAPRPMSGA